MHRSLMQEFREKELGDIGNDQGGFACLVALQAEGDPPGCSRSRS